MNSSRLLIVDDVFTAGRSMEEQRAGRLHVSGFVAFARNTPLAWINTLWQFKG